MAPQLHTMEQVREYLTYAFPSQRFEAIIPSRHGWICRPELTTEETAQGHGLGLSNYAVHRETGIVTVHASLDPVTIGEMYDQAISTGQPVQGAQIYPPLTRTIIQRAHETATTIRYLVRTESLSRPPEPSTEFQLTIDKNSLNYHPADTIAAATTSWVDWKRSQIGTWPDQGTFEE
ncbi:hypothetical protein [Nocardia sp. alder85J]|uniref:hypothetical protein n=1 Tax=Nocardia sp. alder85J TaxID=2862949 RepID=UPI001CD7E5DA|nr:hypothetical protein [Nocardia sp. alder85J]MCX4093053.1 hypothetical protein [Nocardia sp. alder85J]